MRSSILHYAGALEWTDARGYHYIGPGYAACCSGVRARAIRAAGTHTDDRAAVTCAACRRVIARALGEAPPPPTVRERIAAEREACAAICDAQAADYDSHERDARIAGDDAAADSWADCATEARAIAAKIRARGEVRHG